MNLFKLQLKLHSLPNKCPNFLIFLNEVEIKDIDFKKSIIDIEKQISIGKHNVKISLLNKNDNDTIVDDSNCILHDLAIEILSVKINDVDITHEVKSSCVYKTKRSENDKTYGYMYANGIIIIDFINPAFLFKRNINLIKQ
jgi:hypothetical protein